MSLNHQELADVLSELSGLLTGAHLRKLNAPRERTCQLVFRTVPMGTANGAVSHDRILYIDLTPGQTRLHLLSSKLPAPPRPPAWVMKGRQEIEGARLKSLGFTPGERIVTLEFAGGPKRPDRFLVAELFGRKGQLLLLDEEKRLLMACLGKGTTGEPYRLPDARPAPAASSRFPAPGELATNLAVEAHYQETGEVDLLENARRQLSRPVTKELKKLNRLLSKLESDLQKTDDGESLSRQGEALKVNLGRVKKGDKQVILEDPFHPDGQKITVSLDPARTPVDNMKRIFQRARRMTNARPKIQDRIDESRAALVPLSDLLSEIGEAESVMELQSLEGKLTQAGLRLPKKKPVKKKQRRLPYRSYRSESGKLILVGKTGKDNHELTFKVARGSDLWFHAQHTPGAHVLVRLDRKEQIDEQTLLDAASLAAAGSRNKSDDKVEVTYTEAKNVHPIKGAKPGLASVARSRTILVRLEPKRMARLRNSLED